ncbi:hypothetical protein GCM10011487_14370 [Steroidobacter agaridevorans]|uniref:Uncharacterized protein n=1 Tax=Steroidobacter agaridevorans TaxID=2695856 RepID=A0A829Y831_9GAMM|nr:hypothetical protein [Steroidobacter agaridevorans]GFE79437.1 hypothetical protein GCM10011487_14370 [Steroidobacter agaridevorans]
MKQNSGRFTLLLAMACMLGISNAQAGLVANIGPITDLRVEGTYAFVGMAQTTGTCGKRYWLDMNSPSGRSAYATAMMAFSSELNVYIRAEDAGTRIFSECGLYDIFISK